MAPSPDVILKETEKEVAAVLVHLSKLLRVRNQLCSPFLQLPTETITHILSFVIGDVAPHSAWLPIFITCYCIHKIMCNATDLWWKVDLSHGPTFGKEARVALTRSGGSPCAMIAQLTPWDAWETMHREGVLTRWKNQRVRQGRRLHTLEFYGPPSSIPRLSWIFEKPLPCLKRLKFHVVSGLYDDVVSGPVALELPTGMTLQALDLRNVALPWSSPLFTGLSELHLDFRDVVVPMVEDELLRIFDVSPQLERLSLVQVRQTIPINGDQQLPPERIVRLPALTYLELDNDPEVIGYLFARMEVPALISLEAHTRISDGHAAQSLGRFFPDRLPRRLFSDPPVLEVERSWQGGTSVEFTIGSFKVRFDYDANDAEAIPNGIAACILLVPPSVTTIQLELSKLDVWGWKEFFRSHPEVQSIECTDFRGDPTSKPVWDALSPPEGDVQGILCPRLESIVFRMYADTVELESLVGCLLSRRIAGFKLKHLEIVDPKQVVHKAAEFIRPLVEVFGVDFPSKLKQKVSWF